jgi:hypothetical protein
MPARTHRRRALCYQATSRSRHNTGHHQHQPVSRRSPTMLTTCRRQATCLTVSGYPHPLDRPNYLETSPPKPISNHQHKPLAKNSDWGSALAPAPSIYLLLVFSTFGFVVTHSGCTPALGGGGWGDYCVWFGVCIVLGDICTSVYLLG